MSERLTEQQTSALDEKSAASDVVLSARQQQILKLMHAGKVNKEIARELDISLGTVKQHVAVLFKKLNVSNRTMAVSQGMPLLAEKETKPSETTHDSILALRPCLVLSLGVSPDTDADKIHQFYRLLAGYALDCDALFITHEHAAGDLVFGLKRSSKHDVWVVLSLLHQLYTNLQKQLPEITDSLHAVLVAGYVTVSQNRFGGWSGEAVSSPVIAHAHKKLTPQTPGQFRLDESVHALMRAFGVGVEGNVPSVLAFSDISKACCWDPGFDVALVGRNKEMRQLADCLTGESSKQARVLLLEGESGLGKSRICRQLLREAKVKGYSCQYLQLLPYGVWDSVIGAAVDVETIATRITQVETQNERLHLVIVDDAHLLSKTEWQQVNEALLTLHPRTQVVFSGRRSMRLRTEQPTVKFKLGKLSSEATKQLLEASNTSANEKQLLRWMHYARGVPLFATELAASSMDETLSLALVIVIAARLDAFKVDWKLLYCIAGDDGVLSLEDVCQRLGDSLDEAKQAADRAVEIGVLVYLADGKLAYHHPLVRKLVAYLSTAKAEVV